MIRLFSICPLGMAGIKRMDKIYMLGIIHTLWKIVLKSHTHTQNPNNLPFLPQ